MEGGLADDADGAGSEGMETEELVCVLATGYTILLAFPLYLYIFVIRRTKRGRRWTLSSAVAALGPLFAISFLAIPRSTEAAPPLVVLGAIAMFSFAKTLEVLASTHDTSVTQSFHQFCLFFAVPSSVAFPLTDERAEPSRRKLTFTNVRWKACKRLLGTCVEVLLLVMLVIALLTADYLWPSLFLHPTPVSLLQHVMAYLHWGAVLTLESFASFLMVRITINGLLLSAVELLHGDGIHVDEAWGNLCLATSLRQIWSGWNMVVHGAWYRVIYKPLVYSDWLQGAVKDTDRRRIAAMFLTFAFSGVVHEYLIWCRLGRIFGSQVAFFCIQALILLIEPSGLSRKGAATEPWGRWWWRQVAGRAFWVASLVLTLPIFFAGVGSSMSEFLAAFR